MDQQTTTHNHKRKAVFLGLAFLAVVTIATSAFVILKPRADETITTESSGNVTITEASVEPAIVTIKKGGSVTWVNEGSATRSLVLSSANLPQELQGFGTDDSIGNGESYSYTFEATGTFTYNDPQNPEEIKGTIVIE